MLNLDDILASKLEATEKGVPLAAADSLTVADVSSQGWNLLKGDLPFPAAVIKQSALEHNSSWMADFALRHNVLLAPHGKTTMAPQLFDLQLRAGAWGITVATTQQLKVCRRFGASRVLMANQVIGAEEIKYLCAELRRDPCFEFYCLADSVAGVSSLDKSVRNLNGNRFNVLIEVGLNGARAGCRTLEQALQVADAITDSRNLRLCGIECYEGVVSGGCATSDLEQIDSLFALCEEAYRELLGRRQFDKDHCTILSAGGSSYFDVAARKLSAMAEERTLVILRSGCYLVHDSLYYRRAAGEINARLSELGELAFDPQPALEVWGQVQSVPEPGFAVTNVGKRDVSHDLDLPVAQSLMRAGGPQAPQPVSSSWQVLDLNDHHAQLGMPVSESPAVGDLLSFGVSHPCTTFDKWQLLWLVDDAYRVTGAVRTFF